MSDWSFIIGAGVLGAALWVGVLVIVIRNRRLAKMSDKRFGKDEFLFMETLPYVGGLDLPERVKCKVYCLKSRVVIEALGHEYSLPVNRIVDVSLMSQTDIQKQLISSAGGAVAGGMAFGPLGAMVGGAVRRRTIRSRSRLLIFTYTSADGKSLKYIVFNATDKKEAAKMFSDAFKPLKKRQNVNINL